MLVRELTLALQARRGEFADLVVEETGKSLELALGEADAAVEIELAERLIEHFLPGFVFTSEAQHDSVYWVDLQLPQPPQRHATVVEDRGHVLTDRQRNYLTLKNDSQQR